MNIGIHVSFFADYDAGHPELVLRDNMEGWGGEGGGRGVQDGRNKCMFMASSC